MDSDALKGPQNAPLRKGDRVEFRDAFDTWHQGVATSDVEGTHRDGHKVHDFPLIFVLKDGATHEPIPWPVEDVRRG